MALHVELEALGVDAAIEMDGELRHARHRSLGVDERRRAAAVDDVTGDAEVPVEPRVVQDAAVHLDAELLPAGGAGIGARVDPQTRRVGVGADDPQRCRRGEAGGEAPRDDRTVAHDVPGLGDVAPRVPLVEPDEAGEPGDDRSDGVPRGRRVVEEGDQVVERIVVHRLLDNQKWGAERRS